MTQQPDRILTGLDPAGDARLERAVGAGPCLETAPDGPTGFSEVCVTCRDWPATVGDECEACASIIGGGGDGIGPSDADPGL